MFQTSWDDNVAPELTGIARDIEAGAVGLQVVAARQFRYPVYQSVLELEVTEPRRFNVLEEFMLRAALELDPLPTLADLAQAFGLDYIFLEKTFHDLQIIGVVTVDPEKRLLITPAGRKFYHERQIPNPPRTEKTIALFDPISGILSVQKEGRTGNLKEFQLLTTVIDMPVSWGVMHGITLAELQEAVQASSLQFHNPKEGKIVTGFKVVTKEVLVDEPVSLYVIYDEVEERWAIQLRKGRHLVPNSDRWLVPLVDGGTARIREVFSMSDEELPAEDHEPETSVVSEHERTSALRQLSLDAIKIDRANVTATEVSDAVSPSDIGVTRYRKHEIRPEFLKLLRSAHREVIIFSPHITEQAVDDELFGIFKELAERNVWILLAHGLARSMDREERPFPVALVKRLTDLRSNKGAPVCCVVFFGRSHDKDVLIDRSVYLNGSYNFLSYHGKWNVRGETVNKFTIPQIVIEARDMYVGQFLESAQQSWLDAIQGKDGSAQAALTIWGALGKEMDALNAIKEAARYDLLSAWLRIIANNVPRGDLLYYATCLEAAAGLFPIIKDDGVIDLGVAWRSALFEIKERDSGLMQTIIDNPSWNEYERLGISSPQETRATFAESLVKRPSSEGNQKKKKRRN